MFKYISISILLQLTVVSTIHFSQQFMRGKENINIRVQARPVNQVRFQLEMQAIALTTSTTDLEGNPEKHENSLEKQKQAGNANRTNIIKSKISNLLLDIHYPIIARKMGMQGTVIIRLYIGSSGKLDRYELVQSSGFTVLDNAALTGVASWGFDSGSAQTILVPVKFRLL